MIVQSKKVWIADQFVPAGIDIQDGKIAAILPYGSKDPDDDYGTKRIVPGFMDIHCHGAFEFDTNDANEAGLRYWAEHIVGEGVTGFLPTTITQSKEVLTNAVANVANVMESNYEGAEILGIHFEGPYLDMKYKGAQPEQYIVKPTIEEFQHYQKAARGHIKLVTMATETDEDFALTRYLDENGVVVSIGHSAATYEQALMAYANGASSMTHVYNGMTPFNHRANGLVGAAYRFRTMYGEIICDACHSTPAALNNYFMSKGPDYAIMVSDALMAKGTPVGSKYLFAVGAAGALVCRILEKHPKSGLRVRRLHRMEVVSALCYCLSAFFMFYADTVSDWLAFLTAGAVLQLYTSFMLPRAERQEREANKK